MTQHIRPATIDELDESTRQHLTALAARRGGVPSRAQLTLARRPAIMKAVANLQEAVMREGTLEPSFKMLIAEVVSGSAGCRHCQAHSAFFANLLGEDAERIRTVWEFESSPLFSEGERAVLRLAIAAGQQPSSASAEHFDALRLHYTEDELVEIVAVCALFGWNNRWNDVVATETEDEMVSFAMTMFGPDFDMSRHL